mgnify:CR=1 FL=1
MHFKITTFDILLNKNAFMKKQIFLFVTALLSFLPAFTQKNADLRLKGLDTMINRVLSDWHAAGCGVAVVEKNKVLFAGGFGFSDYEAKKPATANTITHRGATMPGWPNHQVTANTPAPTHNPRMTDEPT